MAKRFEGQVFVVTGGATGIGGAAAQVLGARGARLVLAGRNAERGDTFVRHLASEGIEARFVRTDVSREAEVVALFEAADRAYGRIDGLFNNAGLELQGVAPLAEWSEADCDLMLSVNVKGMFLGMKHAIPRLTKAGGGTIINCSSFVGTLVPLPDAPIYGATKAAIISMTRSLAAGYADKGVRIYAVCPWMTDTPMNDRLTGHAPEHKEALAGQLNPSGKLASAMDVGRVVADLFAGDTSYPPGEALFVDHGGALTRLAPLQALPA
jgi:NAD(P)-dependent dehydrogenase (short-subunit alcohol dehydrogenase family)